MIQIELPNTTGAAVAALPACTQARQRPERPPFGLRAGAHPRHSRGNAPRPQVGSPALASGRISAVLTSFGISARRLRVRRPGACGSKPMAANSGGVVHPARMLREGISLWTRNLCTSAAGAAHECLGRKAGEALGCSLRAVGTTASSPGASAVSTRTSAAARGTPEADGHGVTQAQDRRERPHCPAPRAGRVPRNRTHGRSRREGPSDCAFPHRDSERRLKPIKSQEKSHNTNRRLT